MLSRDEIMVLLLCQNRPGNVFSGLPKKIIVQRIGGINADKALECIINTDYKTLFNILSIDPFVMFAKTRSKDVDGTIIETTPLKKAFQLLDKFAWELCYLICEKNKEKYSNIIDLYLQQAEEVKNYINLQPLFDAYNSYIEQFDLYQNNIISREILLQFWLKVGENQRSILPWHMLKFMCKLSLRLRIAGQDLILVRVNYEKASNKSEKLLNEIIRQYDHCPMLFFLGSNHYKFYQYDFINKQWECKLITESLLSPIDFPEKPNIPEFRKGECILKNKIHLELSDYARCESNRYVLQDMIFMGENRFKKLLPMSEESKLGIEFTLARGNSAMCFAIDNPTGHSNHLKYKAADDMESFKQLLAERIVEKNDLIAKINKMGLCCVTPCTGAFTRTNGSV